MLFMHVLVLLIAGIASVLVFVFVHSKRADSNALYMRLASSSGVQNEMMMKKLFSAEVQGASEHQQIVFPTLWPPPLT